MSLDNFAYEDYKGILWKRYQWSMKVDKRLGFSHLRICRHPPHWYTSLNDTPHWYTSLIHLIDTPHWYTSNDTPHYTSLIHLITPKWYTSLIHLIECPHLILPSEVAVFTWKMPTVLKRMKNQFSDSWLILFTIFVAYFNFQASHRQKKMYPKVAIFTWKMRKVLKRMKNRFCIFSFWDVIDFVLKFRIFFVGGWGARRPWTPRFVGAFFGCVHTYWLTGLIFIYYWKW